ncbi:phosphotransferase [Loktanella sp. SALINAS62]|uniref:aminoglycoside phosphotransferase family protein n=1 Tax=Loktanella sp. SALINAS62 TaxID=2706124 RepID=UPI001B8CBA6D|nr:phosphotransferase [Loktanella sp. SALINAS62]MBS1302429.1 phosphotransferase [Loktanella sp. SALINAS62]
MTDRAARKTAFLTHAGHGKDVVTPIAGDASARRYDRLTSAHGGTVILMDADPATGERTAPFVDIARYLTDSGLTAPHILHHDADDGFVLLSDLGHETLAAAASRAPQQETVLYDAATDVLIALDRLHPPALHRMTPQVGADMVAITATAYANCDPAPLVSAVRDVLDRHAPAADHLALRDFHAENLIWRPDRTGLDRVGLLDFQDAFIAPRGYDLASLLGDIRRDMPPSIRDRAASRFADATGMTMDQITLRLAVLSAQRNLRILGVFARLIANGKPRYRTMMPRVWSVLMRDLGHPALSDLRVIVLRDLPPVPA